MDNHLVNADITYNDGKRERDIGQLLLCVTFVCSSRDADSQFLATFRCEPNVTHIDIKCRTVEGQTGMIQVYVMAGKICRLLQYQVNNDY